MYSVGTQSPVKRLAGNAPTVSLSRVIASCLMRRRRSHLVSAGILLLCCLTSQRRDNVPLSPQVFILLVMSPHSDDLYRFDVIQNLIDQTMLYIDAARPCTGKVSNELLVGWRCLIGVFFENAEYPFGLRLQTGSRQFFCISLRVLGKNQPPAHHLSSSSHSSTEVLSPSRIESRMPGMDVRYRVS